MVHVIRNTYVVLAAPNLVSPPFPSQDTTAEQTCLDVLSGEPKSEICDMPCQMQLAVESVEMSVEASMNGHIVPEVSIEG